MSAPEDPFTCVTRRHYAEDNLEFDTLADAIAFATADTDDYYVGLIKDASGRPLYDHLNPLRGWVREDDSLPEIAP